MNPSTRITPLQFLVLTISITFGTSILTLPRKLAKIAGENMWMPVLLGAFVIYFSFRISLQLAALFPNYTSVAYHRLLLGNFGGTLLNIYLLTLMVLVTALFLRLFVTAIKIYLLDLTPLIVVTSLLTLPVIYAAQYGLIPVLRLVQFIILPAYSLFLALILLGFLSVKTTNYQPVLAEGIKPVLLGIPSTWMSYSGIELLIGFLYSSITRPKALVKFGLAAIVIIAGLYLLISLITLGILGAKNTMHILVPTIMAYRSVEIPDTFVERLDGYLMVIWIAICFDAQIGWIYFSSAIIKQMFDVEYVRPIVALLIPIIIYLVMLPPNIQAIDKLSSLVNLAGIVWGLIILPLLLILALWKRKRNDEC